MTTILLFTGDLRLADNPALHIATAGDAEVVALFALDDGLIRGAAAARRAQLLGALADVDDSLRSRGNRLTIRRGPGAETAIGLAAEVGANRIVMAADVSGFAQRRECGLRTAAAAAGFEALITASGSAVQPGSILTASGRHFQRFTPYWLRWQCEPARRPLAAPGRVRGPSGTWPDGLTLAEVGHVLGVAPDGGEAAARRRWRRWRATELPDYPASRERLDGSGGSRSSAALHLGCISANEVRWDLLSGGPEAEPLLRQLCWRDFFRQALAAEPQMAHRDHVRPGAWRQDAGALFEAWRTGRTGIPIVDAGMRQLALEGWLGNRMRMVVASYLTRDLRVDWRRGAAHFLSQLCDGDIASNAGNWQWVAGTGLSSRPQQMMNPLRQADRFDPDGTYVRRYCPEIAHLPGGRIHRPWHAAVPNSVYPAPLCVPHDGPPPGRQPGGRHESPDRR